MVRVQMGRIRTRRTRLVASEAPNYRNQALTGPNTCEIKVNSGERKVNSAVRTPDARGGPAERAGRDQDARESPAKSFRSCSTSAPS